MFLQTTVGAAVSVCVESHRHVIEYYLTRHVIYRRLSLPQDGIFRHFQPKPDRRSSTDREGNLSINSLNLDLFLCSSSVNKGNKTTAAPSSALSVAHVTDKTVTPISLWPNCSLSTFGQTETSLFPPLGRGVESNAGHRVLETVTNQETQWILFQQM